MSISVPAASEQLQALHVRLHAAVPSSEVPVFAPDDGLHLQMSDSTRFFEHFFLARAHQLTRRALDELLAVLETFLTEGDEQVTNAVDVSFIENLLPAEARPEGMTTDDIISVMPPHLRQAYRDINVPPSEDLPLLLTDQDVALMNRVLDTHLTVDSARCIGWNDAHRLKNRCFEISRANEQRSGKPAGVGQDAIHALRAIHAALLAAYGRA